MSNLQARDNGTATIDQIRDVLALYEDPKNPDSKRQIATIAALFRASENAANALSWGEAMGPGVRVKFALFCARNGFDPSTNHVYVLGGRPYVSVEGRMFKADNHRDDRGAKTFNGFRVDRVLTKDEREAYEVPDGAIGWYVEVERNDCKYPFVGVGIAGGPAEKNPVANGKDKLAMAQKRAREKALRIAYPIGEPDVGDEIIEANATVVETTGSTVTKPAEIATATPAAAATAAAPTESPERAAEVERFKRIAKIHGAATTKIRAERELSDPKKVAALDAAGLKALNDAIEAAAADPRGPALRQEIAAFRVRNPEAFNAKLAEARAVVPDFDPERASADDLAVFLSDLNAAVGAGAAQ